MYFILNKVENFQPVISVDDVFTEEDLENIKRQFSTVKAAAAIVGDSGPNISQEQYNKIVIDTHKIRKSNTYFLREPEYDWIYKKLEPAINHVNITNYSKVLYSIEPLQYSEYDSEYNGFYGKHIDCHPFKYPLIRSLSFSVQITKPEEYEGGDLLIYNDDKVFKGNRNYGTVTFLNHHLFMRLPQSLLVLERV